MKLTPQVHRSIVESVRCGNYLTTAAEAAGIKRRTAALWLQKGQDGYGEPYESFASDLEQAKAEAEAEAVKVIREAAYEDWKAAKFWLERAFPARWAERPSPIVTGEDGQHRVIEVKQADVEQAEQQERKRLHGGQGEQEEEPNED